MMVQTIGKDASSHPLVHKIARELVKIENGAHDEMEKGQCWIPCVKKDQQSYQPFDPAKFF